MQEIWKPVPGYEGRYDISTLGNVRTVGRFINAPRGRTRWIPERNLSTHITARGYVQTMFKVGTKNFHQLVHRLVAAAFIDNPDHRPQVNHIDGNKLNNCVTNLEWCTSAENCAHARRENLYEQARGENGANAKLTNADVLAIRARLRSGETHKAISLDYQVSRTVITRISNGTRWASIR